MPNPAGYTTNWSNITVDLLICHFILTVCTPLGFARLFTVVGQFLVKPQFLRDIEEEFHVASLEQQCLKRRYIRTALVH